MLNIIHHSTMYEYELIFMDDIDDNNDKGSKRIFIGSYIILESGK